MCPIAACGKAFTSHSGLARHKRSHEKVKPYVCPICQVTINLITIIVYCNVIVVTLSIYRKHTLTGNL